MASGTDHIYNSFSQGIVSPKMAGRTDSTAYHNGVSVMENFLPMIQGGFRRRSGTVSASAEDMSAVVRVVPFVLDSSSAYLVLLGGGKLRLFDPDSRISVTVFENIPWTDAELAKLRFSQDYETLYLLHPSYDPRMLTRVSAGQYTFGKMAISACTEADYPDLNVSFGDTDYPSGGLYYASKLWMYASQSHPFKFWVSKPFEPTNFETYDMVEVVDDVASAEAYEAAIKSGDTSSLTSTTTLKQVISADNAMVLELGGNRNDRIMWMGASGGYVIIGTASSEWIMPSSSDALDHSVGWISGYGSADMQCVQANDCIIFAQKGGKKVRAFRYGGSGISCIDLTFQADGILDAGVRDMVWQGVPEPRLYCVLMDGTMAVLCYDQTYGMMAWCRFSIDGTIIAVCVLDSEDGEDVYILTDRNGTRRLERFDETSSVYSDLHDTLSPVEYSSRVVTERIEPASTTVARPKRITKARIRMLDSGPFRFGYDRLMQQHDAITQGEAELLLPGGYDKDLRITVSSVGDNPLCLLAMVLETEVT